MGCKPVIPALEKWRQGYEKLKVVMSYIANPRLPCTIRDPVFKKKIATSTTKLV